MQITIKHLRCRQCSQRPQVPLIDKYQGWEHIKWILGTGKTQFLSLWPKNDFDTVILICDFAPVSLQPIYLFIHVLEGEIQIKRVVFEGVKGSLTFAFVKS